MKTTGVPTALAAAPLRTVRPLMLRDLYANPEKELLRLQRAGRVVRIASGTYTVKPDDIDPDMPWRPNPEEAAMAYATAQYGDRIPVLYGIGAARFHHAIPRAIATTVIAVPQQHRPVVLTDQTQVTFTTTDVDALDARLETGRLGAFLVTTPEQTFVDLIARPQLGGLSNEASTAVKALAAHVDPETALGIANPRARTLARAVEEALP